VDWFLDEVDAHVRQSRDAKSMHILWKGLELASPPRVRGRLREYLLDTNLREDVRVAEGRSMFEGADAEGNARSPPWRPSEARRPEAYRGADLAG
jgi:hypothetical protein